MKSCKVCGKPAIVYVVDIVGGVPIQQYLCNECAMAMNINPQHFQIADIFKDVINALNALQGHKDVVEDIKCGECGMTYSQFKKTLRFGCAHDYELFNAASLLEQIHGANQHVGKKPGSAPQEPVMAEPFIYESFDVIPDPPKPDYALMRVELQQKLDDAVTTEDYETAARLRDEIKALPKNES